MDKVCKVCGRCGDHEHVRCSSCHGYWIRHKTERPTKLHNRILPVDRKGKPAWCEVCGSPDIESSGKCVACYEYWQKYRKVRPRRLWDPEAKCKNCKIILASLGRQPSGKPRRQGDYCQPCASYRTRTGKARPRHLWGIGEYGFCLCGFPAVALVAGDIPVCERHRE